MLLQQYAEIVVPPRTGKPGRPRKPYKQWPEDAAYATVNRTYRKGKVAAVDRKLVHGTDEDLSGALVTSASSGKINTAFVERQNGTDRCYNARKARKTYQFSKDLLVHVAVTWWVVFCYSFRHLHRSLRLKLVDGTFVQRTPAMMASLAVAPLTIFDILTSQLRGFIPTCEPTLSDFGMRPPEGPAPWFAPG